MSFILSSNSAGGSGIQSINGDTTSAQLITAGSGILVTTNSGDTVIDAIHQQTGKGILSGGAIWSGTGFVFDVTALSYFIDGVVYQSSPTQVTLSPSDPSEDRFDVIVVDDTGTVSVVTGTPGTPPSVPEIGANEVEVTIVLVEAGSTQPTITSDLIYDENAGTPLEWATSVYNIAGVQTGTVVYNSNVSPYSGTVCAKATGTNLRRGMRFTRGTDINIQQFGFVALAFRIDNTVLPTTKSPIIRFQNSGGTLIGNSVNLVNYGLSRTLINTWQLIVIPVTAFGNITNVRSLTAIINGSSVADWSMDRVLLSGSIPPQSNLGPIFLSASSTLYSTGAAYNATSAADSIFFGKLSGFNATYADGAIFLGKNTGYKAQNASYSVFIGESAGSGAGLSQESVFIGHRAGYNDTYGSLLFNTKESQFIGYEAGFNAGNASYSTFIGIQSGYEASNAAYSTFIGKYAGQSATDANNSVFIGYSAGKLADSANNSIFIGNNSGYLSVNAARSMFMGDHAGSQAVDSARSVFFGYFAGEQAIGAYNSMFAGYQAGQLSTDAHDSIFFGYEAGYNAPNAANSVFLGYHAGYNDTVNNTVLGSSILIGPNTSTGGFSDSIALGASATNTATNQLVIGSVSSPINTAIIVGTGGIQVPVGTTGERIATQGMIRYNTTTSKFEGYDGSTWVDLN